MTPSWSKRWTYYGSQAIVRGDKANAGSVARVSAPEIVSRVIAEIVNLDQKQETLAIPPRGRAFRGDVQKCEGAEKPTDHHERIRSRIERVTLDGGAIRIALAKNENEKKEANHLTIARQRRRLIVAGKSSGARAKDRPPRARRRQALGSL
jgi:hypothetical protein